MTRESGRPVVVIAATNRPEDGSGSRVVGRSSLLEKFLDSPMSLEVFALLKSFMEFY